MIVNIIILSIKFSKAKGSETLGKNLTQIPWIVTQPSDSSSGG